MRATTSRVCLATLLAILPFSQPAAASDGALEIHQACVAAGCFPGDSPGFPVQLTQKGSYILTSNLLVPDENTTAISSTADAVSIDLGGFIIGGVTDCSGNPTVCSPLGTGRGVDVEVNRRGSVRNGTVQGMGGTGVQTSGIVEKLIVRRNGGTGIANLAGLTRDSEASINGGLGISCSAGSAVNNLASNNGRTGITGTVGPVIRGNRVVGNGGVDSSPGIRTVDGYVWGNQVQFNDGPGLQADGTTVYGNNNFRSNNLPANPGNQVASGGTQLGPNLCQNAPCP